MYSKAEKKLAKDECANHQSNDRCLFQWGECKVIKEAEVQCHYFDNCVNPLLDKLK